MTIKGADARGIGFVEDFSLADNRLDALKQLVPGSRDYYYYHCLHAQNNRDFKKVNELVKQWIKREGYTGKVKEILNRQALLEYERHPEKSLEHFKRELGIHFNHHKKTAHRQTDYPSTLDQGIISVSALLKKALSNHENLGGIEQAGLDYLDGDSLNPARRRDLLSRLELPDFPNLPKLVVQDLKSKHSSGFGSLEIHYQLTRSQLEECLRLAPDLMSISNFVHAYIAKLAPSEDTDVQYDRAQKKAYLDRLWRFAKDLTPAHNSLKAHVLFHLLDHHRSSGHYDLKEVNQLFMTYLKIPRQVTYINSSYVKHASRRNVQAVLTADFDDYSLLDRVGTDESLVRDYLSHYFISEKNLKAYSQYIRDDYLQLLFAETKITNGIGDMEQWYSMMPPAAYQALKDRVDLDFSATNKRYFATSEPVALSLFVKNVKRLIVKVFEINTFNYYRANHKPIDTAIELDGLVATHENVIDYKDPPLRRNQRTFNFPGIDKPGVYVVEFIGNGKSSRAVIRKGNLFYLDQVGPDGHEFTIYDDSHHLRPNASIHLAGRQFKTDENGVIVIPFTEKPGQQEIIIQDGDQCALSHFNHESENYDFKAGIYVDRESLIKREKAHALIRPMLRLNGHPVSHTLLEQVRLTIESTNIDGVSTTKDINDFELHEDKESKIAFQVPENLQSLRFTLRAKVKNISRNKKEDLTAQAQFNLNSIDRTLSVEDFHLSRKDKGYVLELLGKNGEAKPNQPLNFEFKHRYFIETVHGSLQTDDGGRVDLGKLEGVQWVRAEGQQGSGRTWRLTADAYQYPAVLHTRAEEALRIPYVGPKPASGKGRMRYALFEKRGGSYFQDYTDAVKLKDGFMVIGGLPAGNYELHLKDSNTRLQLLLTDGKQTENYIMSEKRVLEVKNPDPLHISTVDIKPQELVVHLENASDTTRLHLFATRYLPSHHPFDSFNIGAPVHPQAMPLTKPVSQYVAGRNIGDEYRYILERAHADKFPGNMLNRPELLLNPWSIRKTETVVAEAEPGQAYESQAAPSARRMHKRQAPAKPLQSAVSEDESANLDFLATPSTVLSNLKPDESGRIIIDRNKLGRSLQIHLVAVDHFDTVYRQVVLENQSIKTRELRQAQGLDPEKHFGEQKKIARLMAGDTFQLTDITTSEFEAYDALTKVYNFMMSANKDATLREFGFVLTWPDMTTDEKLEKYTTYACHELNVFLYHKDRDFFNRVIMPHIKNKKDKTFVDHWLLGDDLTGYLEPWAFGQLNIAEKILLSKYYPDQAARITRYVKDRFDMLPIDIDQYNHLFDMALRGKALDDQDTFGLEDAKDKAVEEILASGIAMGACAPQAEEDSEMPPPEPALLDRDESPMKKSKRGRLKSRRKEREEKPGFFRKLDKTREWAENNYYKRPTKEQNADLIRTNAFWRDYAENSVGSPFYSKHFIYATGNFPEMMLALAVLDLPFKSAEHESDIRKMAFTLKAGSPMIVFHKQIKPVEPADQKSPILIHQNYFQSTDPFIYDGNERHDKFVREEFLFRTPYGCQVVVGNPTSSRQKLRILLQIPNGAIPVQAGFYTKSVPIVLEPFGTRKFEYHFYFPESGQFRHYPVQVTKNEEFLTSASPWTMNVVEAFTQLDKTSWEYISQHGSEKEVLKYIEKHNLNRIDPEYIAFRMRDRKFFEKTIQVLRGRHFYHPTLWSYGMLHQDKATISEFLQHSAFVNMCGSHIRSSLLNIDPVERKSYQHLEYRPLVNARAHQLGSRRTILNDRFHQQYQQFMKILSYRDQLTNEDLLDVTYYLLVQDRIKEAFDFFERIEPSTLATRIQHDYLRLYFDFYMGNISQARTIAAQYGDYPVLKWRKMFRHALDQLNELEGQTAQVADTQSRDQHHGRLASRESSFDFKIESRKVSIQYQNLTFCQVNYYPMDIELLFSRNPFVQQDTGYFTFIRPNHTLSVKLPEDQTSFTFDLPDIFHNSNLMVEIDAGGVKKSTVYYANSLDVQVMENFGQLKVIQQATQKPLPKTYIKTYARMRDGSIKFFKDGYTDIRGKFDYVSLNTSELDAVEKFAVLILNEQYGAVIREAAPPKR